MLDLRIPGLPDWANLAVLVAGLMIMLAWVLMPFAVFGVKGRIEALEARLEVIHEEIRQLNLRIVQAGTRQAADFAMPAEPPTIRRHGGGLGAAPEPRVTPPIPPPPAMPERAARPATPFPQAGAPHPGAPHPGPPHPGPPHPGRAEPKLSWPPRG